jgi:glycosyltransferase involved in cell wall biosynthesis
MDENKTIQKYKIGVIGLKGIPAYGGSARAGESLIELLKDKYKFTIYNSSSHTDRTTGNYDGYTQIVFKKFPIRSFNTFVYYIRSLIHCLFYSDYDLVHVYHIDAAFIIPLLKLKYKVIAGIRARPQLLSKWNCFEKLYFITMEHIFLKIPPDIMTSNSLNIIDEYKSRTAKHIFYIPNGILFSQKKPEYPVIEHKDYILFASGRIIESKGCHILLEALKIIDYKGKVLVVGDLSHSQKYAVQLNRLANNLDVTFIGLIKEKHLLMSYIKNAKISVYPSSLEAMSNMLLEIASMKVPIICSDIPENTVVLNQSEALHFKNKNTEDLAEKISWALNNLEYMKILTDNAYQKLLNQYNWEKLALKYDELFHSILKEISD